MSDIENAINDLVQEQVDSRIDDALANNYDFQDLMSRVETLEDSYQPFHDEDMLLRLARMIVKDNSDNRVITYQSTIDNLKAEVDELKKKLAEKENI
jgi:polyhydroxyalkanoate synthesis regulator phasin|tara:strand:- start:307 stop:597 length:291 start_codon:yes stop_codon:yes gene_type:complete